MRILLIESSTVIDRLFCVELSITRTGEARWARKNTYMISDSRRRFNISASDELDALNKTLAILKENGIEVEYGD